VGFKKTTEILKVCGEEQVRMPEGSEFHIEGAVTLKPRDAKVVWTRETEM